MPTIDEKRLENEVAYHVSVAQRERENLARTPDELVERYRHCERWRTRYPECVVHFLTMNKPRHICDFGCGSGEMACRLGRLGYYVTGLDVSPDLIEVARERAVLEGVSDRVRFIVADGSSVNFPTGEFDAVLAMSIVHHMPLHDALDVLDRLLCPGGRIAFLEPVAYSRILQWMRNRMPVEKDVSPDERQLGTEDIRAISQRFVIKEQRHFLLLARLRRLVPETWFPFGERILSTIDQVLLLIPGVSHFSGVIALLVEKRNDAP